MKLFQDYFLRHNIKLPVVVHCTAGIVLLKNAENKWMILSISFNKDGHTNFYNIEFMTPVRNEHKGFMFKKHLINEVKVNEYENYIFDWKRQLDKDYYAIKEENKKISIWEMFVYMYDKRLAEQSSEVKGLLFDSLNLENSEIIRLNAIEALMLILDVDLVRSWKFDVYYRFSNYSNWLVELVNFSV